MFAIVLWDADTNQVTLIRDRIGVKPLFYMIHDKDGSPVLRVASEAKALEASLPSGATTSIHEVPPGHILQFRPPPQSSPSWSVTSVCYWKPMATAGDESGCGVSTLRECMVRAVQRRLASDRGVCCMLSGGLDSSIIAAILSRELQEKGGSRLRTYSIGFPDSTDIQYAREVADFIGSDHTEIIIQYEEALRTLPEVVCAIESYDTTTVRASTPMYLLSRAIAQRGEAVVFSGEGSDELFAGYLYNHLAPSSQSVRDDSVRLIQQLHWYDVLRADRCTAAHGLEFREPFLDQDVVQWALSLSGDQLRPQSTPDGLLEKYWLREAFVGWIPESVRMRRKAAFSDAVSGSAKPWYRYIHEHYGLANASEENALYRQWFSHFFPHYSRDHIPTWVPQCTQTKAEPSATVLSTVYTSAEHEFKKKDNTTSTGEDAADRLR